VPESADTVDAKMRCLGVPDLHFLFTPDLWQRLVTDPSCPRDVARCVVGGQGWPAIRGERGSTSKRSLWFSMNRVISVVVGRAPARKNRCGLEDQSRRCISICAVSSKVIPDSAAIKVIAALADVN